MCDNSNTSGMDEALTFYLIFVKYKKQIFFLLLIQYPISDGLIRKITGTPKNEKRNKQTNNKKVYSKSFLEPLLPFKNSIKATHTCTWKNGDLCNNG